MKKHSFMRWILLIGSIMILIGVALMCWMLMTADERTVIKVDLDLDETQELYFKEFCLIPGEEVAYTIKLNSNKGSKYDLHLDFVEEGDHTLKKYARLKIESAGEVVYDELLADAFQAPDVVFPISFKESSKNEFTIVYYLPIDIGNEAENAQAAFHLLITATNQ